MAGSTARRSSPQAGGASTAPPHKAMMLGAPLALTGTGLAPPAVAQDVPADVPPATRPEESETLEEIVVRGRVILRHKEAFSATKMNMELKDIAQSVSVITEDLMEMADVKKFQDIYRVDASVGTSHRLDDFPTNFFRGFTMQGPNAIRVDGFRFPGNVDLDTVTFERFELVKGPTSALFGQNSLGGTINAVTKQPTADRVRELGLELGSYDTVSADFDFSGPLAKAGDVQYRLLGAWHDSDTFVDLSSDNAWVIAPSIGIDVGERTRIVAAVNYQEHQDTAHWGTGLQQFAPGEYRVLPASREHFFGQPWNDRSIETFLATAKLDHKFTNGWSLRVNLQSSTVDKDVLGCSADGNSDENGVLASGCYTYWSVDNDDLWGGEVNLIGEISLMGREHTLFFGVDYSRYKTDSRFSFDYIDDNGDGIYAQYVIGGGVGYRLLPRPSAVHPRPDPQDLYYFYDGREESVYAGVTLQALLRPTDRLQVLLSGRFSFDEVLEHSSRQGSPAGRPDIPYERVPEQEISTDEFVPQVGVTYSVTDEMNLYVNWGKTFEPSFNFMFDPNDPAGRPLPPEEGEQLEFGFKGDILGGRASITGAIFEMERSGLANEDKQNPGFSIPVGTQNVKGVEFSIAGDLTESIDVYWSLAYLDAEYRNTESGGDNIAPDGARPVNTPKFASSLFMNYAVRNGPLEGLGFGVGWVYKDLYAGWGLVFEGGDAASGITYDLGNISEVDLRMHYETGRWLYHLSVTDVLDDKYHSPVRAEYRWGVNVNPGRHIAAGVKYRY